MDIPGIYWQGYDARISQNSKVILAVGFPDVATYSFVLLPIIAAMGPLRADAEHRTKLGLGLGACRRVAGNLINAAGTSTAALRVRPTGSSGYHSESPSQCSAAVMVV